MRIGALIQARMTSRRLPGKILCPIAGRPILQYVIERVRFAKEINDLGICTSTDLSDDPIVAFCESCEVPFFRGELQNVAHRYRDAADYFDFDAFVRICGDSPLIDPGLIDHAVKLLRDGDFDIVTNIMPRTYPHGQSVEAVRTSAFRRVIEFMSEPDHFERVTRLFYDHADSFKVHNFKHEKDLSDLWMSVDTPDDLGRCSKIVSAFRGPHQEYGLEEIIARYPQFIAAGDRGE